MQTTRKQRSAEPTAAQPPENIPTEFVLDMPEAQSVAVAGDFNHWDASRTPLRKTDRGLWRTDVPLSAGRYEYRFVVDGQWFDDPATAESTPNPFGGQNSIKVVKPPTSRTVPLLLAPPPIKQRATGRIPDRVVHAGSRQDGLQIRNVGATPA